MQLWKCSIIAASAFLARCDHEKKGVSTTSSFVPCWTNDEIRVGNVRGLVLVFSNPDGPITMHSLECGKGAIPVHFNSKIEEESTIKQMITMQSFNYHGGKFFKAYVDGEVSTHSGKTIFSTDIEIRIEPINKLSFLIDGH